MKEKDGNSSHSRQNKKGTQAVSQGRIAGAACLGFMTVVNCHYPYIKKFRVIILVKYQKQSNI